jgi:hypothetical protein
MHLGTGGNCRSLIVKVQKVILQPFRRKRNEPAFTSHPTRKKAHFSQNQAVYRGTNAQAPSGGSRAPASVCDGAFNKK